MSNTLQKAQKAQAIPPAARQPYPIWLGGVAASCAGAITHPLDLTKVRLQTSEDKKMMQSFKRTVNSYGFRGLYDGLTGTLLRQMTYSLMRFAAYDHIKGELHQGPGPPPAWKLALAGSCAGGIAGMIGNPAELMMVRMQADRGKPEAQRYNYRNSIQGLYRMAADEGIKSWFRGVVPNGIRSVLMNASQLGSYDWFKHTLLGFKVFEDGPVVHFLASIGAGTVATTVCSPADVMKSRIMNAHDNAGLVKVITDSVAKEGPTVFFKGWLPAWIRLQPTTILIFLTLEQLKAGVDRYRKAGGTWL
jgi:dicarboxylate transporter 10